MNSRKAGMPLGLTINQYLYNRADSQALLLDVLEEVDPRAFASIRVVAIARENGLWSLQYGEVRVAPEAAPGPHLELGRMVVVSEQLRVPDFVARFRQALATGGFQCGSVEIDVHDVFKQWSFSRYSSERNFSRWPSFVAAGSNEKVHDGWVGPFASVVDGTTLFFQTGGDIVHHITTLPMFNRNADTRMWSMSVIIEDHRARIARVERYGDRLAVHIEGTSLDGLVLAGQLNFGADPPSPFSVHARPEVELALPMGPVAIDMGIVGTGSEILDCRSGHLPAPVPIAPAIEQPLELELVDRIEKLLEAGEHAQCEYKPWVEPARTKAKLREIAKTAVAMANGSGGAILVGVADDGTVTGLDGKILGPFARRSVEENAAPTEDPPDPSARQYEIVRAYGRKLRDEVQQIIEPSVALDLEVAMLDAGPVLLIEVRAGASPPYMITDSREVYVRRNATNRRPTREELGMLHQPRVS